MFEVRFGGRATAAAGDDATGEVAFICSEFGMIADK